MYHSITFGTSTTLDSQHHFVGKNTWNDWHLIPSKRPDVSPPGASATMISIPGKQGSFDMTTWLTGKAHYTSRSGSWEFYVDNDHEDWTQIKNKIMNFIHGKRLYAVLEDDPGYYYEGRFTLNDWQSESWNSMVTINYVLNPYKKRLTDAGGQLWDPFNFDTDSFGSSSSERL